MQTREHNRPRLPLLTDTQGDREQGFSAWLTPPGWQRAFATRLAEPSSLSLRLHRVLHPHVAPWRAPPRLLLF